MESESGRNYEGSNIVSSLWVTEGHHGRYQQVTLKVAPVGDPRDCHGITLGRQSKLKNKGLFSHSAMPEE